jgi:hypothetical protein
VEAASVDAVLGPMASSVADELVALSGGQPEWIVELCEAWTTDGTLVQGGSGRWRFAIPEAEGSDAARSFLAGSLQRVVGDDLQRLAFARDVLACGALEGRLFTADAVAKALARDRDELIDFVDDVLALDGSPLVQEAGFLDIAIPPLPRHSLCLYAFSSGVVWHLVGQLAPERERELSRRMADALRALHVGRETRIAPTLARLYAVGGEEEGAAHYRSLAAFGASPDILVWQARRIGKAAETLPTQFERQRAFYFLLEAFIVLEKALHSDELIEMACAARELAGSLGSRSGELRATALWSRAHDYAGNDDEALAAAREVIEGGVELGDLKLELNGRSLAGDALLSAVGKEAATDEFRQALLLRHRIGGDDSGELFNLGKCLASVGKEEVTSLQEYEEGARLLERARAGYERIGQREGAAAALRLGVARVLLGEVADGVALVDEALPVFAAQGDLRMEAESLWLVGMYRFRSGSPELGREMLTRAAGLYNEVGNAQGVARAFNFLREEGE